jgi:hypothetical protein
MASSLQARVKSRSESRAFTDGEYNSALQKLLDEVGLRVTLIDAANKSEWHNITRPEALCSGSRGIFFWGKQNFLMMELPIWTARDPPLKGGRFAPIRAASGFSAQVAAQRPSAVTVTKGPGAASSTSRAAGASVTASATCKLEPASEPTVGET